MAQPRYVLKNVNLLNIILFIILVYVVKTIALPFFNYQDTGILPAAKKQVATAADAKAKPAESKGPSPLDYVVIADQNPFHPERTIPVPKVVGPPAPPLPKPEFVLFGTMVTADLSLAYMEDKKAPKTTQGRGKRVTALKLGESLSGFVLKEVDADKVVMLRGDESIVVYLADRGKSREGAVGPSGAAVMQAPQPPVANPPLAPTRAVQRGGDQGSGPAVTPPTNNRPTRRGLIGAQQ